MPDEKVTPIHLTTADFHETIKNAGSKPVVVDFWAAWCGPCKMIGPIVEDLANEFRDATWTKVDIEDGSNRDIAMEFGIMSIPTMLVFKNGEIVDRLIGFNPKPKLVEMVSRHVDTTTN